MIVPLRSTQWRHWCMPTLRSSCRSCLQTINNPVVTSDTRLQKHVQNLYDRRLEWALMDLWKQSDKAADPGIFFTFLSIMTHGTVGTVLWVTTYEKLPTGHHRPITYTRILDLPVVCNCHYLLHCKCSIYLKCCRLSTKPSVLRVLQVTPSLPHMQKLQNAWEHIAYTVMQGMMNKSALICCTICTFYSDVTAFYGTVAVSDDSWSNVFRMLDGSDDSTEQFSF